MGADLKKKNRLPSSDPPLLILWDLLKYSRLQSRSIILVEKQIFTRRLELPRLKMRGVRRYGVAQGVGPVATLLTVTKNARKNTH